MNEKGFVDSLIKTFKSMGGSVVLRPADKFTLGAPDLLVWIREGDHHRATSIAIEAKQISPLMEDPFHRGRRTGRMLKHPFSGPQISFLRKLSATGVYASGIVRASSDIAFQFHPSNLCHETGNFTHEEMVKFGTVIRRRHDGAWWPLTGEPECQLTT